MDEILSLHSMGNRAVIGSELSEKLKKSQPPTDKENAFLIRTLGRYLMYNCET